MENKKISSGLELKVSKRLVLVGIVSMGLGIVIGVFYMKQRLQQAVEVNYNHNLKIEHMQKEIEALKKQKPETWGELIRRQYGDGSKDADGFTPFPTPFERQIYGYGLEKDK